MRICGKTSDIHEIYPYKTYVILWLNLKNILLSLRNILLRNSKNTHTELSMRNRKTRSHDIFKIYPNKTYVISWLNLKNILVNLL